MDSIKLEFPEENKVQTFNDYARETAKTAVYPSIGQNLQYPLNGLVEEAGEVAGVIKKASRVENNVLTGFGQKFILVSPVHRELVLKELGDLLWYMDAVAKELSSSLEEVAQMNIKKIHKRLADGTLLATEKRKEEQ